MSSFKYKNFKLKSHSPVISIRTKVWLEVNDQRLIGEGRARLLRFIQESGSINAASKQMGISFRKAWSMVKDMEEALSLTLVDKQRGGTGGGNAVLTPAAIELLDNYEKIFSEFQTFFK